MDTLQRRTLVGAFAAILTMAAAAGAHSQDADKGEVEFLLNCAGCHGTDGKGSGPLSAKLDSKPTDLTLLAKHNHGTFDAGAIYQKIDGRNDHRSHHNAEMPKALRLPPFRPSQNPIKRYQKDFCRR